MRYQRQAWVLAAMAGGILAGCSRHPAPPASAAPAPAATEATAAATEPPIPPGDPYATYTQVEDKLWVGGRVAAPPPGTTAVVCLSELPDPYKVKVPDWQPIYDGGPAPSVDWLKAQVAFIHKQIKAGGQVYVHCDEGYSRGPMVTIAYLMWEHRWDRDKALDFLKARREVEPNIYFMNLLLNWQDELKIPAPAAATEAAKP